MATDNHVLLEGEAELFKGIIHLLLTLCLGFTCLGYNAMALFSRKEKGEDGPKVEKRLLINIFVYTFLFLFEMFQIQIHLKAAFEDLKGRAEEVETPSWRRPTEEEKAWMMGRQKGER